MATVAITPDQDVVTAEIFVAAPHGAGFRSYQRSPTRCRNGGARKTFIGLQSGRPIGVRVGSGRAWGSVALEPLFASRANIRKSIRLDCWSNTWIDSWSDMLKTVVRWELEPESLHGLYAGGPKKAGTGTLVKIRHEGFAGAPENAPGHAKGWERVLRWLEGYLERGETVDEHAGAWTGTSHCEES